MVLSLRSGPHRWKDRSGETSDRPRSRTKRGQDFRTSHTYTLSEFHQYL